MSTYRVIVAEQPGRQLVGVDGLPYTSPPQTEQQARLLAGLLNGGPVDGPGPVARGDRRRPAHHRDPPRRTPPITFVLEVLQGLACLLMFRRLVRIVPFPRWSTVSPCVPLEPVAGPVLLVLIVTAVRVVIG